MQHVRFGRVVLVVEDETLIRMTAAEILTEAGYDVVEADNADDALSLLAMRSDVDAVITDIEMPGSMNGLALATEIRARWPSIRVVITSGRLRPSFSEIAAKAQFIAKPYRDGDLLRCLEAPAGCGPDEYA